MRWLFLLLLDPPKALDWHGPDGKLANAKVVSDLVVFALAIATVYVTVKTKHFPPTMLATALIAGAMGTRVFLSFLKSKNEEPEKKDLDMGDRP